MSSASEHHFYFADYEILVGGRFCIRGETTLDYAPPDAEGFDPAELVERIRSQVASERGVERDEVRIRHLSRL
ncbi:hypothetical protein GLA29479_3659 [Lysobacter antibioticus]|uniref:hypothetical protein n=1 Tax=Lysobacter antibioticus TaxID=84531 RepID=UPI000716E6E4|nr:hypothetical protein [Lysobacter antibioticus]ALN64510.1 hypothetical protein GLA29479_3659 [Lysobacter antibioticus]